MIIHLGESKSSALNGVEITTYNFIERETPKAILLKAEKIAAGMIISRHEYWLPRSLIKLGSEKVEIPDWLWEKKRNGE